MADAFASAICRLQSPNFTLRDPQQIRVTAAK